mgnify:CR=1 FL=1
MCVRLLSLLCLASLLISLSACESTKSSFRETKGRGVPSYAAVNWQGKERWARRDFEKLVLGKTQEEIRKILGDPDNVPDDGSDRVRIIWRYSERTYTPPARYSDLCVDIWFDYSQDPPYILQPVSAVEHSDGTLRRK